MEIETRNSYNSEEKINGNLIKTPKIFEDDKKDNSEKEVDTTVLSI